MRQIHDYDLELSLDQSPDPQTRACLNLWAAVFQSAVQDSVLHFKRTKRFDVWLHSDDRYPGSFMWLCDLFGFDADRMRNRIRANATRFVLEENKNDPDSEV